LVGRKENKGKFGGGKWKVYRGGGYVFGLEESD
jgi:hypothetical protein